MSLPSLEHFLFSDYDRFYEPSEDTFLLLDALRDEERSLCDIMQPHVCLEIGPGSGAVLTGLGLMLQQQGIYAYLLAVDINRDAAVATLRTAAASEVTVEVVQGDLASPLLGRLSGSIDVLLFNPPYVPTPPEEVGTKDIAAAWAGGRRGREVIDRFLPQAAALLSARGAFYMVVVQENRPKEILSMMKDLGLHGQIIKSIKAKNEELSILKFTRADAGAAPNLK